MAFQTPCQTPGATFTVRVNSSFVDVGVSFPNKIELTADEATLLESNIHNALELVLRPYFRPTRLVELPPEANRLPTSPPNAERRDR